MVRSRIRALCLVGAAGACLMASSVAIAQTSAGSIAGRVIDTTGGALPGVTITATNTKTGFSRTAVSGAEGRYTFPSLPVGPYNVTAELSGFTTVTTRNVEAQVSTERVVNISLKQVAVSAQITLTPHPPL